MGILISFLELLLYIAIVCFIAYALVWVFTWFTGRAIDANVYKFGQIIVGLICLIAVVVWLSGLLGGGPGLPHFWAYPR
jgi:hypothetical protein